MKMKTAVAAAAARSMNAADAAVQLPDWLASALQELQLAGYLTQRDVDAARRNAYDTIAHPYPGWRHKMIGAPDVTELQGAIYGFMRRRFQGYSDVYLERVWNGGGYTDAKDSLLADDNAGTPLPRTDMRTVVTVYWNSDGRCVGNATGIEVFCTRVPLPDA